MTGGSWTEQAWMSVLFPDEFHFDFIHPPNRQNDRVRVHHGAEVPPTESVTQLLKIMECER